MISYDYEVRRSVPLIWSVAAVVIASMLTAAITLLFARSPQPEQLGEPSAPRAPAAAEPASPSASASASPSADVATDPTVAPAPIASAACTSALERADAVAQRSTALERALTEHTRIMEELLAQRLTSEQALDETLPVLTRGATERDLFRDELAAYESSREACTG